MTTQLDLLKKIISDIHTVTSLNEINSTAVPLEIEHLAYTTGPIPYGFIVKKENNTLILNDTETPAILTIFNSYAEGIGYKEIIDQLSKSGNEPKSGGKFAQTTLHSILRNEKYAGTVVSRELFDLVQKKLKDNLANSQVFKAVDPYILSGKLFCSSCGGKMVGNRRKSGHKTSPTIWSGYQCLTRKKLKTCDMKELKKETLEESVLNFLDSVFTNDWINETTEWLLPLINDIDSSITEETIKDYLLYGRGIKFKEPQEQISVIKMFVDKIEVSETTTKISLYIDQIERM